MSVLMRGVDMPKNCEECNFKGECRQYWVKIREVYTRPSWCPLVEVADRKTEPQKKEAEWVYNKRERLWYPYSNGELFFKDEPQTEYKKWDVPSKVDLPTGEITTCVSVLASAFKEANCTEGVWNAGYKTGYDKGYKDAQKVKDSQDLVKTESQRDCFLCKWLGEVDVCSRCRNRNLYAPKDEPQMERHLPDYSYEADLGRRIREQMKRGK